jgi:hypothetical protein
MVVGVLGLAVATGGGPASAHPRSQLRTGSSASATGLGNRGSSFTVSGSLDDVTATSAHNAWAVGETGKGRRTLIVHWNGKAWSRVASPSPTNATLSAVAATSAHNAWAAGSVGGNTLILRWNGTAWTQVASPGGILSSVAATSARNAWAVGGTSNFRRSLILRWNGTTWTKVPSPRGYLESVAATSAHNAWAVGSNGAGRTLILHWNGRTWKRTHSPSPYAKTQGEAGLGGVAIASVRSVWVVGGASTCGCGPGVSLVERWNGKVWKRVAAPTPGGGAELEGVAEISARRAWAVGDTGGGDGPTKTLILRRTGTAWKKVPSPHPRTYGNLYDVAVASASEAWAVGDTYADPHHKGGVRKNYKTLIEHWNGTGWK